MLKVNDFWYQYLIASNTKPDGSLEHTVGIATMDGADLAYSQTFDSMTEAAKFRTDVYARMQNGESLSSVVGLSIHDFPAEIAEYDAKRIEWFAKQQ